MKQDRRIAKTKNAIHEAFFDLLKIKDINNITVTELARKADIDRKTFYLHYQSVYAIIEEYKSDVYEKARIMIKETEAFDIRALFSGYSRLMIEDLPLYEYIATKPSLRYLQYEFKEILKDNFRKSYKKATRLSPGEFEVYTEFLASGIIGIYIDWLIDNKNMTLDELTEFGIETTSHSWSHYISCING